jgi:hypothetical protein
MNGSARKVSGCPAGTVCELDLTGQAGLFTVGSSDRFGLEQ